MGEISPCLWFDYQAEDAATFYVSVFKYSSIQSISRYTAEGKDVHGMVEGTVLTVAFKINGQQFTSLNGDLYLSSMKQFRFRSFVKIRKKLIISGINLRKMEVRKVNAGG